MSVTLTVNGTGYSFPNTADENWGDNVTNWATAVTSGMLQKAGGTFTLTSEVNFGATYGLKSAYLKSQATNPSATGIVRLGNTESVSWRNAGNTADLALSVDASNNLLFNGTSFLYAGAASIVNADISASAAIAYSKLALTGSIVDADISASAAIAYSKLSLSNSIVNADISASAAIAYSKLSIADGDLTIAKTSGLQAALDDKTLKSTLTAKGDLYVATASATPARLAVGSDGQVLTADSTQSTGVKWSPTLTNPMTSTGDLIVGGASGAATRLGAGSDGQVLNLASGTPAWTNPPASILSVVTKTANYTLTDSDDIVLLDATTVGAFTLTLHNPATAKKKFYTLKKTDASAVNKITIGGYNLDGASRKLCTQYESVIIYPDGTNWQVFDHQNTSPLVSYTPTITGFATPSSVNFTSCRVGSYLHVEGTFTTGASPTAVEAQITLGFNGTSANVSTLSTLPTISNAGVMNYGTTSVSSFYVVKEASKSYVGLSRQDTSTSGLSKLQGANFSGSTVISMSFKVPITDWW